MKKSFIGNTSLTSTRTNSYSVDYKQSLPSSNQKIAIIIELHAFKRLIKNRKRTHTIINLLNYFLGSAVSYSLQSCTKLRYCSKYLNTLINTIWTYRSPRNLTVLETATNVEIRFKFSANAIGQSSSSILQIEQTIPKTIVINIRMHIYTLNFFY